MTQRPAKEDVLREKILLVLFFLSGMSALIYQVIWQKLLFSAFGTNIQSVAIIVSTFMLGLGLGALMGGIVSERFKNNQILFFILIEFCIGIFGFLSYDLIRYVSDTFLNYPLYVVGIVSFALLLIPATLMGATLPILVEFLFKRLANVGLSIGKLYFSNTCGAAMGSFLAGFILLMYFKYDETLHIAASANLIIGFLAYYFIYKNAKQKNI
jgi:predicted membrane-bound spermidine synthase